MCGRLANVISYFANYHRFSPILEQSQTPGQVYDACPVLFWTVVGIASRRRNLTLLAALCDAVPKLLWGTIVVSQITLPTIQAIILVCTWPFPNLRVSTDKSLLLANVAVASALLLGLHRPRNSESNTSSSIEHGEKLRTWTAATNLLQQ